MRVRIAAVAAGIVVLAGWWLASAPPSVTVAPGQPVEAVLRRVPEGAVIRLLPGVHDPFQVHRVVSIEGLPGASVRGPLTVLADGVRLSDLVVTGGESGIVVKEADEVEIERVLVRDARLHGIEVAPGSAIIRDCRIEGLRSPYAQGLEVRNSSGRPRTVVEGCSVSSGQEGLVSHVSRVEFRRNIVRDTSLRAIVITEMSEGVAEENEVSGVTGIGLYCGDEAHCEFRGNTVRGVAADVSAGRSHGGYGAVALYRATMRVQNNRFAELDAPRPVGLFLSSRLTDRFPLSIWPAGWAGAIPAVWVAGLSLLGLWGVRFAVAPLAGRSHTAPVSDRRLGWGAVALVGTGLAVTSFHMLEHVVQVFQVYVAEGEVRSGLLGALVDTEWVHFIYNIAVFGFAVWLWRLVRPGGPSGSVTAAPWALAALAIQGYHVLEHTAKIVQHIALGVKVAPGLLGGPVGLVWFHFGINLAVFAGLSVPMVAILRRSLRARPSSARPTVPAAAPAT